MPRIYKALMSALFLFWANLISAQSVEMADGLRSDGKIYVVVLVLLIIFIGVVVYLFSIDKKVSKLEEKVK